MDGAFKADWWVGTGDRSAIWEGGSDDMIADCRLRSQCLDSVVYTVAEDLNDIQGGQWGEVVEVENVYVAGWAGALGVERGCNVPVPSTL